MGLQTVERLIQLSEELPRVLIDGDVLQREQNSSFALFSDRTNYESLFEQMTEQETSDSGGKDRVVLLIRRN